MRPIADELRDDSCWDSFLVHAMRGPYDPSEMMLTERFIRGREYRSLTESVLKGEHEFSPPIRLEVPKTSGGTRTVYTMRKGTDIAEHTFLRMMSWSISRRYDGIFSPNLYTCRENHGVRGGIFRLLSIEGLQSKYIYKADITDFGNSIDTGRLMDLVYSNTEECDRGVFSVLEAVLRDPRVLVPNDTGKGMIPSTDGHKGAMTGMPFCAFLSNLYLNELDWYFSDKKTCFFRYNDDMLMVADTEQDLREGIAYIHGVVEGNGLDLNPEKEEVHGPGESFVFLGINIECGMSSVSDSTVKRQKAMVKKMAVRSRKDHELGYMGRTESVARMIRMVNLHFYGRDDTEYTFAKQYFPILTSSHRLDEIDRYVQSCIRYVYTGRFAVRDKGRVPYEMMRQYGYVPLMSAYRMYRDSVGKRHIDSPLSKI